MCEDGGRARSTVGPISSALNLRIATRTFTAAPRRSRSGYPERKLSGMSPMRRSISSRTNPNGTDMVFEIARENGKTELRFTHVGLRPAIECYGKCAGAWGFYINHSLRSLITTGKGGPNNK